MNIVNRNANILTLKGVIKGLIKVMACCIAFSVGIANANTDKKQMPERLNVTNTKLLVTPGDWSKDECHYENKLYSYGAIIVVQMDKQKKQFICSNLNSYELNGKLGWKELGVNKDNKVSSKLTITND